MAEFNRLNDTAFPHLDTVDPYQYQNTYDFDRFKNAQMRIRLLNVPWDLGSVHVGQKIVTGIGNVVYFEDASARDRWFDSFRYAANAEEWASGNYDGIEWITDYRRYHSEDEISLPVPFDALATFNYLTIDYIPTPTPDTPVDFETTGIRKWFYFIRNIRMRATNSSIAEIYGDLWTTYIYDMTITSMILEQGHAPLSMVDADTYLDNPINNTRYLLDEDANFGELQKVTSAGAVSLNSSDMWAVIVTSATLNGNWGEHDNNWRVPSPASYLTHGTPSYYAYALDPAELSTLLLYLDSYIPQFKQTVKGVFFVAKELVSTQGTFTINETQVSILVQKNTTKPLLQLSKSQFGYANEYADLAKLYTYPYAAIEITDEKGASTLVKIEDTTGLLTLNVTSNVAFPYLCLDGRLSGIGGSSSASLTFRDVNAHSFSFSGKWYEHIRKWEIPVFAITQNASIDFGFSTYYDRKQRLSENATNQGNANRSAKAAYDNSLASNDTTNTNTLASNATTNTNALADHATSYDNSVASNNTAASNAFASNGTNYTNATGLNSTNYNNATASNSTTYSNALASNSTAKTNSDNLADTNTANANIQISTNSTLNTAGNLLLTNRTTIAADEDFEKTDNANFLIDRTINANRDANIQSGAISAVSNVVGSAISGASTSAIAGPGGAAVGAVGGLVGGLVGAGLSAAQIQVGINLDQVMANNNKAMNSATQAATAKYNAVLNADSSRGRAGQTIVYNNDANTANNANLRTQTANNVATAKTNASNTKTTADANALAAKNTADANASRTKTTADANALASKNTADDNATRSMNTGNANALAAKNTADANANRTKATGDANAGRTKTTGDANALRTYNAATTNATNSKNMADAAVQALVDDAALNAPIEYGTFSNGETALTRPMALFANIVTQSDNAIALAGDNFLRHGYAYHGNWNFEGNFNIMPKFTYWKCSDLWIKGLNMPDEHVDYIRFLLMGGVTVWRDPSYIGNTTIYDNTEV